jgi:glycosyltransferase involved in cell wall biosynthesis
MEPGFNSPIDRSKPRLLVTTSTLPRFEDDPDPRFVIDLARALADRFEITVLAPSFPGAAPHARLFGVNVIRYRYAPARRWERLAYPGGIMSRLRAAPLNWLLVPGMVIGQAIALRRILASGEYDLIHAHWIIPQGLVAAMLPRRLRIPFVTTSHGGDVFTLGRGPLKPLLRYVLRRAAAITVVSGELLRACGQIAPTGRHAPGLHLIPMGVDVEHFARSAKDASRPADMPTEAPVILFVGRLAEKKGVDILIDALAGIGDRLATAQLVVIGDGPLRQDLSAHARDRNLAHRVHFLGSRNHASLPAYMAAADAIVLPSVEAADGDKDGLPVTLIEGAACSLPSVASEIGGIPEFVVDGYNGLLVTPGDSRALGSALATLLADPDTRKSFAEAAFTTAKTFDWRLIADRYARVYYEALEAAK